MDLDLDLDGVGQLLIEAGDIALRYFRKPVETFDKGDATRFDPVTIADREAESFLTGELLRRFPDTSVYGEEFGAQGSSDVRWVIDPIDGTRAFITGGPLWGVLVGLEHGGEPVAGWAYMPVLGELVEARQGAARGVSQLGEYPLRTSGCTALEDARLFCTHPDMFEQKAHHREFSALLGAVKLTRFGGDCTNYTGLAMGFLDIVFESGLQIYDVSALVPIVRAGGGVITDLAGNTPREGGTVLASATPELHAAALELFSSL